MTPAQQAKSVGLDSLTQVSKITRTSLNTLTNWHRNKPDLFKTVLAGCVKRKPIRYGKWTIEYNPKCIAEFDWDYVHDDHDGEQWSCGCAKSVEACISEINEKELDISEGIYS